MLAAGQDSPDPVSDYLLPRFGMPSLSLASSEPPPFASGLPPFLPGLAGASSRSPESVMLVTRPASSTRGASD